MTQEARSTALDLMTGRWRSQILHAGVKLGIIDALVDGEKSSGEVAAMKALDPANTYRLMRALASIDILVESESGHFGLSDMGAYFLADHPESMRGMCLWEEGELLYATWKHMPEIVRDGGVDGFIREFGAPAFEVINAEESNALLFADAMTSYSRGESVMVLAALDGVDLTDIQHLCDIGGGHGHLLCQLLEAQPHLQGTVLDLAVTFEDRERLCAGNMGLGDRCSYVEGDMFAQLPAADAYITKHILHDWSDEECVQILQNAHRASADNARMFIAEALVPGPDQADFSKLFDIHMMTVLTGRERTEEEYIQLLDASGFRHVKTWRQPETSISVVEGAKA